MIFIILIILKLCTSHKYIKHHHHHHHLHYQQLIKKNKKKKNPIAAEKRCLIHAQRKHSSALCLIFVRFVYKLYYKWHAKQVYIKSSTEKAAYTEEKSNKTNNATAECTQHYQSALYMILCTCFCLLHLSSPFPSSLCPTFLRFNNSHLFVRSARIYSTLARFFFLCIKWLNSAYVRTCVQTADAYDICSDKKEWKILVHFIAAAQIYLVIIFP